MYIGTKTVLITYHAPLQHFIKQLDLKIRKALWLQELVDTPIPIVYWPGKQATVPDALSCSPILRYSKDESADFQPSGIG